MIRHHAVNVLVVEDNIADVELIRTLFSEVQTQVDLTHARDGQEATEMLFANARSGVFPDLILLDINMPRKDGKTVLKELKADAKLCKVPVIFLSTSSNERDITEAYCTGASAFVTKPTDLDEYQGIINSLSDFWFKRIVLPTRV